MLLTQQRWKYDHAKVYLHWSSTATDILTVAFATNGERLESGDVQGELVRLNRAANTIVVERTYVEGVGSFRKEIPCKFPAGSCVVYIKRQFGTLRVSCHTGEGETPLVQLSVPATEGTNVPARVAIYNRRAEGDVSHSSTLRQLQIGHVRSWKTEAEKAQQPARVAAAPRPQPAHVAAAPTRPLTGE